MTRNATTLLLSLTLWALAAGAAAATPGDLDPRFGDEGAAPIDFGGPGLVIGTAVQPDGRILVLGWDPQSGGSAVVSRLLPDGSRDAAFGIDGTFRFGPDVSPQGLALQPSGRILVAAASHASGEPYDAIVLGIDRDGVLDPTFDGDGIARIDSGGFEFPGAIAVASDGGVVVAAQLRFSTAASDIAVYRLLPDGGSGPTNGALDPRFDGDGAAAYDNGYRDSVLGMELLPDGRIVVLGEAEAQNSNPYTMACRLLRDGGAGEMSGALDPSFHGGCARVGDDSVNREHDMALQRDGRVIVVGWIGRTGSDSDAAIYRLLATGSGGNPLDPTFDGDGMATFDRGGTEHARDVLIQPDGKILVAGLKSMNTQSEALLLRLTRDGKLDPAFGAGGAVALDYGLNTDVMDMALQPDGNLLLAGHRRENVTSPLTPVAFRLLGDPLPLTVARAGDGGGSVVSDPAGIDCGAICTHSFDPGTPVTLTATPLAGAAFAGWFGGGCSGTAPCTVTMRAATQVTAEFAIAPPPPPPPPPPLEDRTAPVVTIIRHPRARVRTRRARVRVAFRLATDQPATLRCRIDRKPFRVCARTVRLVVRRGRHRFQVFAVNAAGRGPVAGLRFRVVSRASRPRPSTRTS